jgi:CHAT domain-containing protein/tetratricopeptide (TPR) repeat protein
MSEELNPVRPTDRSDDALARALRELVEGQPARAETPAANGAGAGTSRGCPEPGEWLRLAGADAPPADAAAIAQQDAMLAHAALCRACAERLRLSLRLLREEVSPEESEEVGKLASSSRAWQHQLAVELARTPRRPARNRTRRLYLWAGAGLAASLAIAAVTTVAWQRLRTPERLLAEAYTHARIFDLRIPGAGFAAVTPQAHLRGGSTGRESAKLLDARARIERQLENAPEDAHWLQLEARADVLEEKYDPAIDILDRLLAAGPVTSSLLADDATAYFQRGAASGSENDRATALEYLRRADELAPADTLVLFNEAVVMEDRGQVMNAVETWNRYLRFERDPRWLAEGRRRLAALEQKLNQLKSHQSRMDERLATPQAMRALAADSGALAAIDEELSSSQLPTLFDSAYPMPVDRSRGSPCDEKCQAARALLRALAASLERNHRDPWLTQLLPPESSPPSLKFLQAVQALGQAIRADVLGDFLAAQKTAAKASQLFRGLANAAGEDRAEVERAFALQRFDNLSGCYQAAHPLLGRDPQFAWIQIHGMTEDAQCDPAPGTGTEGNPAFQRAIDRAHDRRYTMLELRARNLLGAAAVDSGDAESAWRMYLPTVRMFYSGDYPAYRLYTTLSGLQEIEEGTPRVHNALLLQREVVGVLELSQAREVLPTERFKLASVAIRAGAISEAQEQMRSAASELIALGGGKSVVGLLAENEMDLASLYLDRRDFAAAAKLLDAVQDHIAGEANSFHFREYAAVRGRLDLELGHPEAAEPRLRDAVRVEERRAGMVGAKAIVIAQQDRDLYAMLAGVWLAQGRPGDEVLALWERYRLRILGENVPACPDKGLTCLQPKVSSACKDLGPDQLLGQIVLPDRLLLYKASAQGVLWSRVPVRRDEVLEAAESLQRAASSPATPLDTVDRAARRVGNLLLDPDGPLAPAHASSRQGGQLSIEPDPLLGNLPWPSVETAAGPIGLQFDLAETPALILGRRPGAAQTFAGKPLIVGASVASGENELLPEVLNEARAVARFGIDPNLLLAGQATQAQVAARFTTASAIHFAGHAAQQDGGTRLLLAPAKALPGGASSAAARPDRPYLDSSFLRRHPPRAARLAVFSACSSGKKEEGWNHGMGDIVDTLAALGVPDVVATRWQIDSGSAVPMMDAFYGGLARGLRVPQALTAARRSLIRDARYRHPYYWAAYYASGSGNSNLSQVFHGGR